VPADQQHAVPVTVPVRRVVAGHLQHGPVVVAQVLAAVPGADPVPGVAGISLAAWAAVMARPEPAVRVWLARIANPLRPHQSDLHKQAEGYELQLPVRRDKPARRRRWKSSTPKG